MNAEVNALERLQIVRRRNSSYFEVQVMDAAGEMFWSLESALDDSFVDDHLGGGVCQFSFLPGFHSTCFRIGSKFRGIRSTPTEMQSMIENDFACFANKLGDDSIENDSMSPTTEEIRNARPLAAVLSPRCAHPNDNINHKKGTFLIS